MDPISISSEHVAYKRKVGRLGNDPVFEVATTGGLHLIAVNRQGKTEVLGTGPHRAVARHIARKHAPEIDWIELSKSDSLEQEHFAFCLPRYEALTEEFRKAQAAQE